LSEYDADLFRAAAEMRSVLALPQEAWGGEHG
jgi:hypothetical protein